MMQFVRPDSLLAVIGVLVLLLVCPCSAQGKSKTGIFTARFSERSPHSEMKRVADLTGWPFEQLQDYEIADHTFQMVVPERYDGSEAYGLLVFIHPNDAISLDRFYGRTLKRVLAKHKLIWVSYSNAGNRVLSNVRMGLALDAVHNVKQNYRIDKQRIYVSGMSGGGRLTCMTGLCFPKVFTGAIPLVGTLYFRDVDLIDDPKLMALIPKARVPADQIWRRSLRPPDAKQLECMTQSQRWVLLAGEKDFNMPEMRAHFEQGFKRDGFKHAHYVEVPRMGHVYPKAKWYDKAFTLLDAPLKEKPADARTQRLAAKRLAVALRTLKRDRDRGIAAMQRLVDQLPNTTAAATARDKLRELGE